jgi:hypothetical protein
MENLTIPFIVLAVMFVAVVIGWSETWKKKEHYRCRVFELTNGEEGSNLVKVVPDTPPPPAPEKLFPTRPLLTEWLHNNCGEYFRRKDVVALTKNPNRTMNVVLGNGHTINTGLELDDLKEVLGISFSCSVNEELAHRKKMYKKEGDV